MTGSGAASPAILLRGFPCELWACLCSRLDVDAGTDRTSPPHTIFHRPCYTGRPPLRRNGTAKPRNRPQKPADILT